MPSLRWTIVAPSLSRPAGGLIALFEIANALVRRGQGVHIVHVPTDEARWTSTAHAPWIRFEPAIGHRFLARRQPEGLPAGDVLLFTTMLLAASGATADRDGAWLDVVGNAGSGAGLPLHLVQGRGVFASAVEERALRLPCPKVCVGSALAAHVIQQGAPGAEVTHIPNGLDHSVFRLHRPIDARSSRVVMHHDPHPVKRGPMGLEAVVRLYEECGVPATIFGARPVGRTLPPGVDAVVAPGRTDVAALYNRATIFLQPSLWEGFGMSAVESMACGCALVTTSNGGADDYAVDERTALVAEGSIAALLAAMRRLVEDDALRLRLAEHGAARVQAFRWTSTADKFVAFAHRHLERRRSTERASM